MEISKKSMGKACTVDKVYKYYFTIINGLLGLTNKEIDIASRLYHYNSIISKSVSEPKLAGVLLFSKDYKAKIVKDLGIKPLLLNNYIGNLKDKGIILVDEEGIKYLNAKHTLDIDKDVVQITFNLKIEEDGTKEEKPKKETKKKSSKKDKRPVPTQESTDGGTGEFNPEDPWADGAGTA